MDSKQYYRAWYQKNKERIAEKRKVYREAKRELEPPKRRKERSDKVYESTYIEKRKMIVNNKGDLEEIITIREI